MYGRYLHASQRDRAVNIVKHEYYTKLKQALEKRFGGKWKIIVRLHFQTGLSFKSNSADVIDVANLIVVGAAHVVMEH